MPVRHPRTFIILLLLSFDSITFFFSFYFSPGFHFLSTSLGINETITLAHPSAPSAKCIRKTRGSIKWELLRKMFKSKWSSLFKKTRFGKKKKLVCDAPHDSLGIMHYEETFNAHEEKQTVSNKDQIFSHGRTPVQRKQLRMRTELLANNSGNKRHSSALSILRAELVPRTTPPKQSPWSSCTYTVGLPDAHVNSEKW